MSQIIAQKQSLCNIVEIQNKISFRKKHIDIKQYKNTENGFILKNYFYYGYKSGIHYEDLTEEIKVYLPRIVKRVFERRKDFVRENDFFVYFDTHEIIDLRDRDNKVMYNLSEYLMEGEELIDIYSFSGPLFFLTNYGRILYRTRKLLQSFTMGDYYFEVLKDKKTIIVNQWGPVRFGLTYFYFTTQDGVLYKVDKDTTLFTIKRVTEVKDKITKIKIVDSKGLCAFKTFKGDWLIYSKSMINSPSYLQNCNFTKLNIKEIILQNEYIKKYSKIFNYSFNCLNIYIDFGDLIFLMDDFTIYRLNKFGKDFKCFDIEKYFGDRNIPFLGGDRMNSSFLIKFNFAPKGMGYIVWWEKTEIITKEFILFQKLLTNNLIELNFIDILIQFN